VVNYFDLRSSKSFIEGLENDVLKNYTVVRNNVYNLDNLDSLEYYTLGDKKDEILSKAYESNYNFSSFDITKDLS